MDLLQIGITVALSTVANQAGRPLIVAGYNQVSKKIIGFWSARSDQKLASYNSSIQYRILLFPVLVPFDIASIASVDLPILQLNLEVQQQLQMLTAACFPQESSNMLLTGEDTTDQPLCNFSEYFFLSEFNLISPNRDCGFQICSCVENQGQISPINATSIKISETLSLMQY